MKPENIPSSPTTDPELPQADWANWALIKAALGPLNPRTDYAKALCANRLQQLVGDNCESYDVKPGPRSFIILSGDGHWGRGNTVGEAAKKALQSGARRPSTATGVLVLNDGTAEVNECGSVISDSQSAQFNLGVIGTIGSVINANK
jgi:hypothetical protein